MNFIVIGLGITIIVLLYLLYTYYTTSSKALVSTASLKVSNPSITSISESTSTRYAYGIWLYVNSWDNTNTKTIFERSNNIKLFLGKTTPSLYCDIYMSDGTTKSILVTDNYPIQRWVHIILSLDNQFLDCYLDGKLIKSSRLFGTSKSNTAVPATPPGDSTPITIGSSSTQFDAVVSKFVRWTKPMDPETAWKTYLSSNTTQMLGGSMNSYSAKLNILQNNASYAKLQLF
jgi:hypothetical protein